MTATILDIRPGLGAVLARARESLSTESRRTLDEHVTAAERLVSDVFGDLDLWRLRGSDALWVRSADLAEVMEVTQQAISTQILGAEASGELTAEDVRRGVRPEDVDPSSHKDSLWLTTSPTGVTVLTLRAARLLVMSCRGERGVRFRAGLDRLLDTASATERLLVALLLDGTPLVDVRTLREARLAAAVLVRAGDKASAARLLRRAHGLGDEPKAAPAAPAATLDGFDVGELVDWLRRTFGIGHRITTADIADRTADPQLRRILVDLGAWDSVHNEVNRRSLGRRLANAARRGGALTAVPRASRDQSCVFRLAS